MTTTLLIFTYLASGVQFVLWSERWMINKPDNRIWLSVVFFWLPAILFVIGKHYWFKAQGKAAWTNDATTY